MHSGYLSRSIPPDELSDYQRNEIAPPPGNLVVGNQLSQKNTVNRSSALKGEI